MIRGINMQGIKEKFSGTDRIKYLAVLLVAGVVMILISNFSGTPTAKKTVDNNSGSTVSETSVPDSRSTEESLAKILEKVKGVSNVSVFITYDNNGSKKISSNTKESIEKSDSSEKTSTEKTTVMSRASSAEEPFVSEEKLPSIRGVLIVAEGVGKSEINAEITEAVSQVLGVAIHKVKILSAD